VRRIGERTFGQGFHVLDEKSALELKGELEALATENARLTALVHQLGENAATAAREYAERMASARNKALEEAAAVADSFEAPLGVYRVDYDDACADIATAIRNLAKGAAAHD